MFPLRIRGANVMTSTANRIVERLETRLGQGLRRPGKDRPWVTLAFAQSLDGSITNRPACRMRLSNAHSSALTHWLRAHHDAILVGINTVLVDDPRLTVRLAEGPNPRPVVVDSRLRLPLTASLLKSPAESPFVGTTVAAPYEREARLRAAGATVLRLAADDAGLVDLRSLLVHLFRAGIRTLMVEGGARIITSFLSAGLADQVVLTICPLFVGGPRAFTPALMEATCRWPRLSGVHCESLDDDLILIGDLERPH